MDTVEQDRPLPPWHPGEIAIQRSVGVADRMAEVGRRVIRDHLIDQHRDFYPQLPFVVLGTVDPAGNAWATLRGGRNGLLRAPSASLNIRSRRDPDDPADAGQEDGDAIALLGIDLAHPPAQPPERHDRGGAAAKVSISSSARAMAIARNTSS